MKKLTADGLKQLEELTEKLMEDSGARGIAIGIVNAKGEIQYEKYFGWRDAEKKLPINRDTVFGMASVTKSITSLAIMQMQMEGILSVEDPVRDYIPEFSNKGQKELVRIWHLLCHSGGFFPLSRIVVDKTAQEMGIEDSLAQELIYRDDFADEGVRRVAGRLDNQTRFTGRPGQRLSYCNDGFGLLSDIVRRHSDCRSFAEYLDKHILKPLDMTRSNISFIRNSLDENASVLYTKENGKWRADKDFQNNAFVLHGGGGLKSTLGDMMKYAVMYLNQGMGQNGTRIIDKYSIEEMCKPRQVMKPGVYYGYGLESSQMGDITVIEHGGSLPGVSSNFAFAPQAEAGVVVLCNTMDVPAYAISEAAMRLCCGLPVENKRPDHQKRCWTGEEKEQITGTYVSGEGDTFTIREDKDGELLLTLNGTETKVMSIAPWQGCICKKYTDVYLTVFRDENQKVFCAQCGSRIFPKTMSEEEWDKVRL